MKTQQASPGRPKGFDPDKAVLQAMTVFWTHGYEGTSTVDLLSAMGLSKSSLYQCFGSKQALFQLCLERYGELTLEHMQESFRFAQSPRLFVLDLIRATATHKPLAGEPCGCLLVNTACELGSQSDVAGQVLRGRSNKVLALFREAAQAMIKKGEISQASDPEILAHQLMTCLCGLKVAEKLGYGEQERLSTLIMVEKLLS